MIKEVNNLCQLLDIIMHLPMGLPCSGDFSDKHLCKEEAQKWRLRHCHNSDVLLPPNKMSFCENVEDGKV